MGRDAIEQELREFFRNQAHACAAVYLFGSVARDEARDGSDVDIAIIRSQPADQPLDRLSTELAGRLERILGAPVEIIDLERAPADLGHRILREGRLVHEADRSKRISVEMRVRARYFDLLPRLAEYRKESRTA